MSLPAPRIPYDRDGTQVLYVPARRWGITPLTPVQMRQINNESNDYFRTGQYHGEVFDMLSWLVWLFPEPCDIHGFFVRALMENGGPSADEVQFSTDTTNGDDGTWSTVQASVAWGGSLKPDYQLAIESTPPALDVTGLRLQFRNHVLSQGAMRVYTAHLYGEVSSGDRLSIWDADEGAPVPGDHFKWEVVHGGVVETRTFWVKNRSASRTATDVAITRDSLTDADPSLVNQHLLSSDGAEWGPSLALDPLGPGEVSGPLQVRVEFDDDMKLGYWSLRINVDHGWAD